MTEIRAEITANVWQVHAEVGGFVTQEQEPAGGPRHAPVPLPVATAADLLAHCRAEGLAVPEVVLRNERTWRGPGEISPG